MRDLAGEGVGEGGECYGVRGGGGGHGPGGSDNRMAGLGKVQKMRMVVRAWWCYGVYL